MGNYLNCRDHIIKYPLFESLTLKFYHMMMVKVMMMIMRTMVMKSWMPRTQPPSLYFFFFFYPNQKHGLLVALCSLSVLCETEAWQREGPRLPSTSCPLRAAK